MCYPVKSSPQRQSGVALIIMLMVVAMASVLAVEMSSKQQLQIRRISNRQSLQQAALVASGAEAWASGLLVRDAKKSKIDSLDEDWAKVLPPMPVDGGQVAGQIEDLQSKFNLNNLLTNEGKISTQELERFQRLLTTLELSQQLAFAVQDWLDADLETTHAAGAEDDYYTGLEHPYRTANRRFTSITELRLVRDFDAVTYAKLAPFISALPTTTSINVNTAPAEILQALSPDIDAGIATAIIEERKQRAFDKLQDFTEHSALRGKKLKPEGLSVSSEYFRVQSQVLIGASHLVQYTWLQRDPAGTVSVLQRARGNE